MHGNVWEHLGTLWTEHSGNTMYRSLTWTDPQTFRSPRGRKLRHGVNFRMSNKCPGPGLLIRDGRSAQDLEADVILSD